MANPTLMIDTPLTDPKEIYLRVITGGHVLAFFRAKDDKPTAPAMVIDVSGERLYLKRGKRFFWYRWNNRNIDRIVWRHWNNDIYSLFAEGCCDEDSDS